MTNEERYFHCAAFVKNGGSPTVRKGFRHDRKLTYVVI